MLLEDEIIEAQSYKTEPPRNESNTCEWIILPLLWQAGYAKRDIESRMTDSAGQVPDYTILSSSPECWYLEAKAWNVALEDIHVKQALNYANQNGKRFVVLTNAQIWRLYDNTIQGILHDKLISSISLFETEKFTEFLTKLSKPEVLSDSLGRLAAKAALRKKQEILEQKEIKMREEQAHLARKKQLELRGLLSLTLPGQLADPNSELILFLTRYFINKSEYEDLTSQTLSSWFEELNPQATYGLPDNSAEFIIPSEPSRFARPAISDGPRTRSLKALQKLPIDGKRSRPTILQTPDGNQTTVRSWVDLAEQVVRWLLQQPSPLPVPFESSHRNRWFLNRQPVHKTEQLRKKFKPISAGGRTIYMDSDRSGEIFLQDICNLCDAMQIEPDKFHITIDG